MKRFLINFSLIITALIIYFLQENFFNWFTIAGVMPNLFVILVLFIGLFTNKNKGTIYGLIIGMFLDFFVGSKLGIYTITLGLVGLVAGIFDKNFSKDSRMTIMSMVLGSTIIFEVVAYIINYIIYTNSVEISKFIQILAGITASYEIIIYFLNYFILNGNLEILEFLKILLIEIIYNIIITIIIYPLIKKFGYYIENEYKGNKILTRYF